MKLKSLILAMFLTLGTASSFANVTNNTTFCNNAKTELFYNSTISEVSYLAIEESDDCKWTKYIRVTTTTYFIGSYHIGTSVTSEFVWRCV
jgi:hypothetical protein